MTKSIHLSLGLGVLLIGTSCSPKSHQEAQSLLKSAGQCLSDGAYTQGLNLIDSLAHTYPTDTVSLRQALSLQHKIYLEQADQELGRIDSRLSELATQINQTQSSFREFHNEAYQTPLRYYAAPFYPTPNIVDRSGISVSVDSVGNIELLSRYSGSSPIEHSAIALVSPSDTQRRWQSPEVVYDGALNFRSNAHGRYHESISYPTTNPSLLDALDSLCNDALQAKRGLRMEFLSSGKVKSIESLSLTQIQALHTTLQWASLLKEKSELSQRAEFYQARKKRLLHGV